MTRLLLALCSLLTALAAGALDTLPGIIDPSFRTLKVQKEGNFYAAPILTAGVDDDALTITFDRIAEDTDYLRFRLIHCNADWQPSQLVESEYLDGFNDIEIEDAAFPAATFIHYVNYRITIPSEKVRILRSGNYLLQVYDEEEPDKTLLQARFSVAEPLISLQAHADANTDRGLNDVYQQLTVTADVQRADVRDPFNDLILTVEQNYEPWGEIRLQHPQRVSGEKVIYEHLPQLIMRGGNEYRRFETVNLLTQGMGVDSVRTLGGVYHAFLTPDIERSDRAYSYDQTQSGRFVVRNYNGVDPDLSADYVTTHFTLEMPQLADAEVYVDGEFNSGRFDARNRMKYDPQRSVYTAEIPLKQGSYNYRYVVVGRDGIDPYYIDGDKYETRNEYTVKMYVREPGSRADRLVGFTQVIAFQ